MILFSCSEKNEYDIDISNLQDRLIGIEKKINNINSDINLLRKKIQKQSHHLTKVKHSEENNHTKNKLKVKKRGTQFVDPEALFKKTYKAKKISKGSCYLINVTNKERREKEHFGVQSIITIKNDYTEQDYEILELDPIGMCINIRSINYEKNFTLCMGEQE